MTVPSRNTGQALPLKSLLSIFFLCLLAWDAAAQGPRRNIYHADKHSGLPSDYVYNSVSDRYGYLWLATERGVVRYNGYSFKTYSLSDGLANRDVWGLYLDKKNRVWIRSITNRLGFFRYNRFVEVRHPKRRVVYPKHIVDYRDGIAFISTQPDASGLPDSNYSLFIEKDDSLILTPYRFVRAEISKGAYVESFEGNSIRTYRYQDGKVSLVKECPALGYKYELSGNSFETIFNRTLVQFQLGMDTVTVYMMDSCLVKKIPLRTGDGRRDFAFFADYDDDYLYIKGRFNFYKIDPKKNWSLTPYPLAEFLETDARKQLNEITNFYENAFWGRCYTSRNNGIFLDFGEETKLKPLKPDLSDYACVGRGDTVSYWWSKEMKQIALLSASGNLRFFPCEVKSIGKILSLGPERLLISSQADFYLMSLPERKITLTKMVSENPGAYGQIMTIGLVKDIVQGNQEGSFYATGMWGVKQLKVRNDSIFWKRFINTRYDNVRFNRHTGEIWSYNINTILRHTPGFRDIQIDDSALDKMGIANVEQLLIDTLYGNVIIRDYQNLHLLDLRTRKTTPLLRGFNISESQCLLRKNILVIAGKFGLLFLRIQGYGAFSDPVYYTNLKYCQYETLQDFTVLNNSVFLQTDRGLFTARIPSDADFKQKANAVPYKLIVSYRDTLHDATGKSLALNIIQPGNVVRLDVINPRGAGSIHYRYFLEGISKAWEELSGDEIHLPSLKGGGTYMLHIVAYDDVWTSENLLLLHIVPYWYQTFMWKLIFWLAGFAGLALFIIAIVGITRHYQSRTLERKRATTELELRAIYSQINPHFIFNTLNIALYFIKKKKQEEAHDHITRFSKLLRAYLSSSRNRYISIADEISNLKTYMELQQARFSHIFDYSIRLDGIPQPDKVLIPSLLLQPIIENAIDHGLLPKDDKGNLWISFIRESAGPDILCVIEDDGVGRERARDIQNTGLPKQRSYGTELIGELIELFNRYEKMGIELQYEDRQPPLTGTRVTIRIKKPL